MCVCACAAPSVIIHSGNCYSTFLFDWKLYFMYCDRRDWCCLVLFSFLFWFFFFHVSIRPVHQISKQRRISVVMGDGVGVGWLVVFILILISSRVWDTRAIMSRHIICYCVFVCVFENMKCHNSSKILLMLCICIVFFFSSLVYIVNRMKFQYRDTLLHNSNTYVMTFKAMLNAHTVDIAKRMMNKKRVGEIM